MHINFPLFQEEGAVEIIFDLIGFELDPEKSHQSGFFTPDFAHMWMNPGDITWKNRSGLALTPGSGLRPDDWRMRWDFDLISATRVFQVLWQWHWSDGDAVGGDLDA